MPCPRHPGLTCRLSRSGPCVGIGIGEDAGEADHEVVATDGYGGGAAIRMRDSANRDRARTPARSTVEPVAEVTSSGTRPR